MADEVLGTEVVEFKSDGLTDIVEEVKKLEAAAMQAFTRQAALNQLLKDPAYRQRAEEVRRLTRENAELADTTEKLSEAERQRRANAERDSRLRSGDYRREVAEMAEVRREAERLARAERGDRLQSGQYLRNRRSEFSRQAEGRRQGLAERATALGSGDFVREQRRLAQDQWAHTRQELAERRALLQSGVYATRVQQHEATVVESARIARAERRTELQAVHGRTGGSLLYGLERARPGFAMLGGLAATPLAMARSGFSGTAEGNRFELELRMLNREIAATLAPALRELTRVVRSVREWFQGLSGTGQNLVGAGILGAGAIGAGGLALGGIGSAFGGLRALGLLGAGPSLGQQVAAQAGGSAIANYAGGGAVGAAARTAAPKAGTGTSILGRVGRTAGRLAGPVAAGMAVYDAIEGDYYRVQRAKGNNRLVSGLAALGGGALNTITLGGFSEWTQKYGNDKSLYRQAAADRKAEEHRSLTPSTPQFIQSEDYYRQLIMEASQTDISEYRGPAKAKANFDEEMTELLRRIDETLKKIYGDQGKTPSPVNRRGGV